VARPPPAWRHDGRVRLAFAVASASIVTIVVERLTAPWFAPLGTNPLGLHGPVRGAIDWAGDIATMTVDAIATGAVVLLVLHWHDRRRISDDPLPAWLLAGAVAAWLALVPVSWAAIQDHFPAPHGLPPGPPIAPRPLPLA